MARKHHTPSHQRGNRGAATVALALGALAVRRILLAEENERAERRARTALPAQEKPREHSPEAPKGFFARSTSVTRQLFSEISTDRVLAVAAGVAYYALLALFPAITALVSIYGLIKGPQAAAQDVAALSAVIPASVLPVISDQVQRIAGGGQTGLSLAAALAIIIALWSANGGMKAMMDALNVAYDVDETRGFFRLNMLSLGFTFSAVILSVLLIASVAALPALLNAIHLGQQAELLLRFGRWPVIMLIFSLALSVLYRFGPRVPNARWRWISPGSVLATIGFVALSSLFSLYASYIGKFNETYGSLGAVIAFLTWSWLVTVVTLVGAELNAILDARTHPSQSTKEVSTKRW